MNDDNELLQAEDLFHKKFPTFSVHFDNIFFSFYLTSPQDPYHTECSKIKTNENHTTTNAMYMSPRDVSRFPVVSSKAIGLLQQRVT